MIKRATKYHRIYQIRPSLGYLLAVVLTIFHLVGVYFIHLKAELVAFQLPLAAVALTALFAGAGPAVLSIAISTLALVYIGRPAGSSILDSFPDTLRLVIFIVFSWAIIWATRRLRAETIRAVTSEARFIEFVDHLDHTVVWNARASDLSFSFVGKRVSELLGYSEEEWIQMGASVWDLLVPEEDRAPLKELLSRLQTGRVKDGRCDHRFITKDGQKRWFQTGADFKDDANRERYLYGVSADISPVKLAHLELEKSKHELEQLKSTVEVSEKRLSSVLDTALDAIVTIDQNGLISSWNIAAEKLFGYTKSEVLGHNVHMLMPQPYKREHDGYIQRYKETGVKRIIGKGREVTGLRKDGTTFPMDLAVSEFWSDGERHFTGIIHDITERKKFEAALEESEARFRVALKNAPITVYTCDKDLRYTWVYGLPRAFENYDLVGRMDSEVFEAGAADSLMALKRLALETGVTQRTTIRVPTEENIYTFDITAEPTRDDRGAIDGLIVASLDVSEIAAARTKAEEASNAKSNFLSNISHEIRTPIGVIQGFAELLLDQESRADARHMLSTIVRNTRQLTSIIGEVLDVSKIEADKLDLEIFEFPLSDLIDDVKSVLKFKAEQKGISFRTLLDADLPASWISDPTRLKQILINLGSNAIKFTSEGSVDMIFRHVQNSSDGGHPSLEILVRDNGIGMSPEQQARIFAPFVQADNSMTRRYGGTGLGLFISKRLARALSGDLQLLRSEPGKGSEFLLTIQGHERDTISAAPKRAAHDRVEAHETQLADIRILLAEDSIDNQQLVTRILERYGAKLVVANNGAEAVRKASENHFDVILMDIQMPEVDGFEATKRLRVSNFDGPIIALTAHALKEEREKALSSGFSGYVTKPINRNELIETIQLTRQVSANSDSTHDA